MKKYWIGKVPVLPLACQWAIIFSSVKQGQCALLAHLPSTSLLEPVWDNGCERSSGRGEQRRGGWVANGKPRRQQLAGAALGPVQLQVGSPPREQRIGPQLASARLETMFPKRMSLASICMVEEVPGSPAWLVTYSIGLLIPASETPALVRGSSWTMWDSHGQWSPTLSWLTTGSPFSHSQLEPVLLLMSVWWPRPPAPLAFLLLSSPAPSNPSAFAVGSGGAIKWTHPFYCLWFWSSRNLISSCVLQFCLLGLS